MRRIGWVPLFALATGCAQSLDEDEAHDVIVANLAVASGIERWLDLVGVIHTGHGGVPDGVYDYDATLDPGLGWTEGTIDVLGQGEWSKAGTLYEGAVDTTWSGVTVGELVFDGPVAFDVLVDLDATSAYIEYTLVGEIDVGGEAAGPAAMDWMVTGLEPTNGTGGTYTFTGSFNDYDVATLF